MKSLLPLSQSRASNSSVCRSVIREKGGTCRVIILKAYISDCRTNLTVKETSSQSKHHNKISDSPKKSYRSDIIRVNEKMFLSGIMINFNFCFIKKKSSQFIKV